MVPDPVRRVGGGVGAANLASLVLLVRAVVSGEGSDADKLLLAALQVWLTSIIVFGLLYWERDRCGPVKRTVLPRAELLADFRSQRTRTVTQSTRSPDRRRRRPTGRPRWWTTCSVGDQLHRLQPERHMPPVDRGELLMSVRGRSALVVSVLVIAEAVSGLK